MDNTEIAKDLTVALIRSSKISEGKTSLQIVNDVVDVYKEILGALNADESNGKPLDVSRI